MPNAKKSPSRTPAIKALGGYTAPARMKRIFAGLDRLFPDAHCALDYHNPFQLLVATVLSAQCTDVRVNAVTPALFAKYSSPRAFADLRPEELEPDIYSCGFYRNKAKSIVGLSQRIVADFHGAVPRTMDALLSLPGVARKTANVVLGSAFGIASGIVVDTHMHRVATRRLMLSHEKAAAAVERDLLAIVPQDRWIRFSYQMTLFGREVCLARKPLCATCPLEPICDSPEKTV